MQIYIDSIFRMPLIFRQPPLSAVANIFVLPLEIDVWICICILLLVVFIIMMFQLMHPMLKSMPITPFDVATFIWGAICQQVDFFICIGYNQLKF